MRVKQFKPARTLFLATVLFCLGSVAIAQETDDRYDLNQYGQRVESFPLNATVRNGITMFSNRERGYRFWFDNRVQVDMANYHNIRNGRPGIETPGEPAMTGGISLRRVRMAIKAEINHNWYGEVDFNMANGTFGLQDAFIQYNGLERLGWQFKLGNFKEDFSMEYTTSSRYVTFMERPMAITGFEFSRFLGFQAQWHHFPWLRMSGGVAFQDVSSWEMRTNVANMQNLGMPIGPRFTGKVVGMPFATQSDMGLHLGYNVQYRDGRSTDDNLDELDTFGGRGYRGNRFSSRNSTHINRHKFLDVYYYGVKHDWLHGLEFAGYLNGWRIQSEFIHLTSIMDRNYHDLPGAVRGDRVQADLTQNNRFYGWHVQTTYLLFGGKHRYDLNQSEFTQPTRGRSWGDIELAFRYDYLNLNNNFQDRITTGGAGQNFSFGVVYWMNSNMRVMLNYQISQNDQYAAMRRTNRVIVGNDENGSPTMDPWRAVSNLGTSFNTLQARFEIAF